MICNNCGYKVQGTPSTCPSCGNVMATEGTCGSCGNPLDIQTDIYCQACGALNPNLTSEEGIVCDTHIENRAVGYCVVCGKAVCEECLETAGNRLICDDPQHRTFLNDWKVVYTFDFEYEAAMLYANLEQNDIETQAFTKPNPDSSEAASLPTRVEVLVPKNKYEEAIEVAKMLGLTGDDSNESSTEGE